MKKILTLLLITAMLFSICPAVNAEAGDEIHVKASDCISKSAGFTVYTDSGAAQATGGATINYKVSLGSLQADMIQVKFRTGTTEAGSFELHLDNSSGKLLGTVDAKTMSPLDWYTVLTAYIPLEEPISGDVVLSLANKKGTHTYQEIVLETKDPNAVERGFASLSGLNSFNDISDDSNCMEINLMTQMGLFPTDSTNFLPMRPVTRIEFAAMLGKIIEAERYSATGIAPFLDVEKGDEASALLEGLYSLGILKGDSDGNFRAKDFITLQEVASVCVNALGYRTLPGGATVWQIANRLGIFKGIDSSEMSLNRSESARVLYNLFLAETLVPSMVTEEGIVYMSQENYIENNSDFFYGEGVVSANYYTDLYVPIEEKDTVTINGFEFDAGDTRASDLLGVECEYFYYEVNEEKVLAAIYPNKKATIKEIKTNDKIEFEEISERQIVYFDDEKEYECRLDATTAIIYNGIALDCPLNSLVDASDFVGTITLIDNDNNRVFDCVWIDHPQTMVISKLGAGKILDEETGFVLDTEEGRVFLFKNGSQTKITVLTIGDVLTVYQSANKTEEPLTRVIADRRIVSGTVEMLKGDIVVIDGMEYKCAEECDEDIYIGLQADFYLNAYNRIVTYKIAAARSSKIGLFMAAAVDGEAFSDDVKVRILTENNNMEVFQCSDVIKADGVSIKKPLEFYNGKGEFAGIANVPVKTPVLYEVDSQNRLCMIDTELTGRETEDDVLTKLDEGQSWWTFGSILINTDWEYIHPYRSSIKTLALTADNNEDNYGFIAGVDGVDETVFGTPYTFKRDSIVVDLLLAPGYSKGIGTAVEPFVFEEIESSINEDGVVSRYICGVTPTGNIKYEVVPEKDIGNLKVLIDSLKQGDIIQPVLTKSRVTDVKLVYLPDGAATNAAGFGAMLHNDVFFYEIGEMGGITHGTVEVIEDGFMRIKCGNDSVRTNRLQASAVVCSKDDKGNYHYTQQVAADGIFPDDKVVCYLTNRAFRQVFIFRDEKSE